MTVAQSLLAFTLAAIVLAATPGIDTALVLRMSIPAGARRGLSAAFGIAAGCLLWGAVVATGLGALLAASGTLFTAVKFLGAAYLVWQGVLLLRSRGERADAPVGAAHGETAGSAFAKGFLTNALNPKVGIFYLTLLPQFVPAGVEVASFSFLLASIHVAMSLLWFVLLIALTRRSVHFLQKPSVVAVLDRLTGVVFLGFGLKLAVSQPA
ncbi:Threonine efflux protein [Thauera sp. GDN1]|uniref:LysE family translocator n=1 Tax=Thauera sp. GDN1 TaxID=2944810 RepID=UPI00247ADD10|nr:LysE family translocator [Thauera sp. GDN1]WEN42342.1 Threonine efflux protein [Thauera sp. GDN1]